MSESKHLSIALTRLVEDNKNDWLCPLTEAITGLNAAQAAWVPTDGLNSIWALVNHICIEAEVVGLRLRGQPVDYAALGAEDGWPPAGKPGDEFEWQQSCQRAISAHSTLASLITDLPDEDLTLSARETAPGRWYTLQCLIAHTNYHTGQVVLIRRLQGSWNPLQWMPPSS